MIWDQAGRRPYPHDAAERRRNSDRAAEIGSLRDRHHAGRDRHRRASGGAGRAERAIPRIGVAPNTAFTVFAPVANSGVLVFASTMAPAALSRRTASASSSGT